MSHASETMSEASVESSGHLHHEVSHHAELVVSAEAATHSPMVSTSCISSRSSDSTVVRAGRNHAVVSPRTSWTFVTASNSSGHAAGDKSQEEEHVNAGEDLDSLLPLEVPSNEFNLVNDVGDLTLRDVGNLLDARSVERALAGTSLDLQLWCCLQIGRAHV